MRTLLFLASASVAILGSSSQAADSLRREASWSVPSVDAVAESLVGSLTDLEVEPAKIEAAVELFRNQASTPAFDLLNAYVSSASSAVPAAAEITEFAQRSPTSVGIDLLDALDDVLEPNFKLWVARDLVRLRFYDEAMPMLQGIDATATVDPAGLMFYRAAASHALLDKETAISDLEKLLENEDAAPLRFIRTARLMLADIKPLKKDSLNEISRLMGDDGHIKDVT